MICRTISAIRAAGVIPAWPMNSAFYCSVVFKHFGDRIPAVCNDNEPNHNAYCDYCVGNYPPNETNLQHYCSVLQHGSLHGQGNP